MHPTIPARTVGSVDRDELRTMTRAAGSHWFDADTMRLFRSRLVGLPAWRDWDGKPAIMFISSDAPGGQPRRYTVRAFVPGDAPFAGVSTVGVYMAYPTAAAARKFLNTFPRR